MKSEQIKNQYDNDNSCSVVNLYNFALILADAQSRSSKDSHACFIDNLSRICDEFATSRQQTNSQVDNSYSEAAIVSWYFANHQKSINRNC